MLKKIGSGLFSQVFAEPESDVVYILSKDLAKLCYSEQNLGAPYPTIEKLGWVEHGYLYRMERLNPVRSIKQLKTDDRLLYDELRAIRSVGSYYALYRKLDKLPHAVAEVLEAALNSICDYVSPDSLCLDISKRNVMLDKNDKLVLLDCFFSNENIRKSKAVSVGAKKVTAMLKDLGVEV